MKWLSRLANAGEAETPGGRALLEERFRTLQRQIPLLYLVIFANMMGLYLAAGGGLHSAFDFPVLLTALIVFRFAHWLRVRDRVLTAAKILRELHKMWLYAIIFSLGFCAWAFRLLATHNASEHDFVILFASLAAIGCAYGVSRYPAAARLPLLLLGLPLTARLAMSPDPGHILMGLGLGCIILVLLRFLDLHDVGFRELVESRTVVTAERERARRAERLAKGEKAKAKLIADTDPLTGLANRRAFVRALTRRVNGRERAAFALAMVDLDGFKPINDTFGHATGDRVLQSIGARLGGTVGDGALVARTGGDEFALLLPRVRSAAGAVEAGASVCAALQEPFLVEGREFRISGCCGVAVLKPGECDVEEALIRADTALYRAKDGGRAGVAVFTQEMQEIHRRRAEIEKALRLPGTIERIGIVFQPIIDLATGELKALEALARWHDERLGRVPPDQFIPIAEQINAIEPITEHLLAQAGTEAKRWADTVKLSFNVSAVQLCTPGSSSRILTVLDAAGLAPSRLQVEVTETALLADFEVARDNLQALRGAGARIVLDDFGAGHASISYLREMQFDGIKLDGALIASLADSLRSRRLLKGVLDLCAAMGLPSVAEHIETEDQLRLLRELGCREGQGFLLSPPLHAEAAAALAAPRLVAMNGRAAA